MNRYSESVASMLSDVVKVRDNVKLLRGGARSSVSPESPDSLKVNFNQLVVSVCGEIDPQVIMRELGLDNLASFVAHMTPALGVLWSAKDTAVGVGLTFYKTWQGSSIKSTGTLTLSQGDPLAAFKALELLIDREITSTKRSTLIVGAAFTAKTLFSALDMGMVSGPAIGLAEVIAKLIQKIAEFVQEKNEVDHANDLLKKKSYGIGLFQSCPILGCYYLVVQDHSTIINMAVADYGTPDWMFDVEAMMVASRAVLDKARAFVNASPFVIDGFEDQKGIKEANWAKLSLLGKAGNLKQHVIDGMIDAIFPVTTGNKVPVDLTRIVGFGSENPPIHCLGGKIVLPSPPKRSESIRPSQIAPMPLLDSANVDAARSLAGLPPVRNAW